MPGGRRPREFPNALIHILQLSYPKKNVALKANMHTIPGIAQGGEPEYQLQSAFCIATLVAAFATPFSSCGYRSLNLLPGVADMRISQYPLALCQCFSSLSNCQSFKMHILPQEKAYTAQRTEELQHNPVRETTTRLETQWQWRLAEERTQLAERAILNCSMRMS